MEILEIKKNNFKEVVDKILSTIKKGKIIICPTDTVYGLICDATNKKAVEKIFKIKKRPKTKPLAVFVKDIKMAKKYALISKEQERFLKQNWPGAVTAILNSKSNLPKGVISANKTIGIRIPDYRLTKLLFKKIDFPIAQTSANISENKATTKIKEVLDQFLKNKDQSDLVINAGNLKKARPSKVVDLTGDKERVVRY